MTEEAITGTTTQEKPKRKRGRPKKLKPSASELLDEDDPDLIQAHVSLDKKTYNLFAYVCKMYDISISQNMTYIVKDYLKTVSKEDEDLSLDF